MSTHREKQSREKLKLELQALFSCSENASGAFEFDQREWTQVVDFRFSALATSVSCNVYSHLVVFDVETHSASDGVHNTFLRARSHCATITKLPDEGSHPYILAEAFQHFSFTAGETRVHHLSPSNQLVAFASQTMTR